MKVTYYGHVGTTSGYGIAAAHTCMAMLKAGIELEIMPLAPPDRSRVRAECVPLAPYIIDPDAYRFRWDERDLVIVHTLPLDCQRILELHERALGHPGGAGDPAVAYTTWETITGPPLPVLGALAAFDDVWVPSTVLERDCTMRAVETVPHAFDDERALVSVPLATPGRPEDRPFRFYYVGAWSSRKNVHGLVRAFCSAFRRDDNVELVLHTKVDVSVLVVALASTGIPQDQLPRVRLTHTERMSGVAMEGWVASMDCFVTATRGEAWNLPAFEALAAGRMIISPANLGSDDFLLDTEKSILLGRGGCGDVALPFIDVVPMRSVGGAITMVTDGAQGMSCRDRWQEPNLVALADAMRYVYQAGLRDNHANYSLGERFGYAAVGKIIREKIEGVLKHA